MLDKILFFLFRRKTGLLVLGITTFLCALTFSGCFTMSVCACGLGSLADCQDKNCKTSTSYDDLCTSCFSCRTYADCFQSCDENFSRDCGNTGCNVIDCACGYGYTDNCNNGTVDCGGCNATCFTGCKDNDCSGSCANGCETCNASFSNCKYEGNLTKEYGYSVYILFKVVDDSDNEITQHGYTLRVKTSEIDFQNHLKQTINLDELKKTLDEISFFTYFENALTFSSTDNNYIEFNNGQYELNRTIDLIVKQNAWSSDVSRTIEIRAKAHERNLGNPVKITLDYSAAGGTSESIVTNVGSVPDFKERIFPNYVLTGYHVKGPDGIDIPFDPTSPLSTYKYKIAGPDMRLTVYAEFEKKSYTLKVIKTVDGEVGEKTIESVAYHNEYIGTVIARLQEEKNLGKDEINAFFRWWAFDADGNRKIEEDSDVFVRNELTIYCKYAKKLTLTLSGTKGPNNGKEYITVGYGDEIDNQITLHVPDDFDRFTFNGWYTDEALTNRVSSGTPITEDTTLYASWTAQTEYKIYYYADKKSFVDDTPFAEGTFDYENGTKLLTWEEIKNSVSAPTGYEFVGWRQCRMTTELSVLFDSSHCTELPANGSAKDYRFVAEFKKELQFFTKADEGYLEEGKTLIRKTVYFLDYKLPVPTPKSEKYIFSGWSESQTTFEPVCLGNGNVFKTITQGKLFAFWSLREYTLKFVYSDEEKPLETTVEYGKTPTNVPVPPDKPGYDFIGWYDNNGAKLDETAPVTKNADYTASYAPKKYKITLMVNGKEFKTVEIEYLSQITLGTPPSGLFIGWFDSPDGGKQWTDTTGTMNDVYSLTEDVTLYARFL